MTELDLGLKAASRRLLWRMGHSTRVDVALRAIASVAAKSDAVGSRYGSRGSASSESFTDLDVLGISVTPSASVRSSIVDCKTGGSSTISRMFWVRGLRDFFEADEALLVRERPISKDARQLANRLGLTALTAAEVTALEALHPTDLPLDKAPLSLLFDPEEIARVMQRSTGLDKRLNALAEFRQFDYWIYPEHLNLIKTVEVLRSVKGALDVSNPIHTGLLFDCAWLYVVSSAHALQVLRSVHVSDLPSGLSEYLAGGPSQLRQKREISEILARLQQERQIPASVSVDPNPTFFEALLELETRLLRRNSVIPDVLRLLEFETAMALGGRKVSVAEAFGDALSPIAAKLALDVITFLVESADLKSGFIASAQALIAHVKRQAPSEASEATAAIVQPIDEMPVLFDES